MRNYFHEAREFLNDMADKYLAMRFFLDSPCEDTIYDLKHELEERYGYMYWDNGAECRIEWGVSKAVFILPEHKYVIKIPFEGLAHDYCSLEAFFYQQAKSYGMARHFAPCERMPVYRYDNLDNDIDLSLNHIIECPVYLMEYCTVNSYQNENMVSHSNLDRVYSERDQCDIIRIFSNSYDDEEIIELLEFLEEQDMNDFHNGNIGIKDGLPILIDYSGYKTSDFIRTSCCSSYI